MAQTVKNLLAMQETQVQSLGQEDSPGEGNGNPLQYSCLEKSMDRGTWWAAVHGVAKSRPRLSTSAATVYEGSLFSTSSPTFVICVLFDGSFDGILTGVR